MISGLLQPMHLLLILVVVLVVFGPGKLGNLGHDLGKSIREFKAAMDGHEATIAPAASASAPTATEVAAAPKTVAVEAVAAESVATVAASVVETAGPETAATAHKA
ncbi:MAG: twin arginine-targeting protein translocase, TatA/E family [Solidesulfovibrio magneticus str. Maddingley MBC34]|uniref:Sec-independent protein translocase protein TatA n=1 Tax=Solidesulfovibrio magneticus str. Maddingley MBC34 TaxID=1206767 RepID=K6GTR3_9BACT|nr:MAG: twin arginine-targeting protein translocase, TatA/E family [Solidesulfovibrio magneticus str. Maddingley MBC34]